MADASVEREPKHTTRRRPFTTHEDAIIMQIMHRNPGLGWDVVAKNLRERTARQCRERWINYLSPSVRVDPWTEAEDRLLVEKVNELGFSWSGIAPFFRGRSDNAIKNRWYCHLKYNTTLDGAKYVIAGSGGGGNLERKKRHRVTVCPKQNAIRWIEQQRVRGHPAVIFASNPHKEAAKDATLKNSFDDLWERNLVDDGAEENFGFPV
jgi:hypothetical protein